jgi:LysR family transcriptional regulator, nod-box dependent transcriptional activator
MRVAGIIGAPSTPGSQPMRYQRIDLNLLIALDVLLAEQNVTRASERLHMTQSATSGILARLRDHFDDPLLVASGRTMRLTPLAESLLQPVRDIVLRIDATLSIKPDFDPALAQRHFVIIASDYVARVLLADVLRRISHSAPGLTFDLRPTHAGMTADLEQGQADFLVTPAHLAVQAHPQTVLFEDSYRVIACAQHPDLGDEIGMEQYLDLGHVVYQDDHGGNPWFEQWYANEYGRTRRIEVITHGFNLIPRFLVGTRRLATIQTRLALQVEQSMPIRVLPPPMNTPRLTEVLQWQSLRQTDPGTCWVRDQILDAGRRLPQMA